MCGARRLPTTGTTGNRNKVNRLFNSPKRPFFWRANDYFSTRKLVTDDKTGSLSVRAIERALSQMEKAHLAGKARGTAAKGPLSTQTHCIGALGLLTLANKSLRQRVPFHLVPYPQPLIERPRVLRPHRVPQGTSLAYR